MTAITELKALLEEIDNGPGGFAQAMKTAQADLCSAKARIGQLRELSRILKTTTEKAPRKRRKTKSAEETPLLIEEPEHATDGTTAGTEK